jgi:hypothetical protein
VFRNVKRCPNSSLTWDRLESVNHDTNRPAHNTQYDINMQDTYLDVYICMYAHMYVCISVYVNVYVYYLFVSMVYLDEVLFVPQ